jgi:N-formylglutamate amidohydrolase
MDLFLSPGFATRGPKAASLPVILSVPHAGRTYPTQLLALARPPHHRLYTLEDRYADHLITGAVAAGAQAIVATAPRLWIDLNRGEQDIDPNMVSDPIAHHHPMSVKARGGLGLIPRRTSALGELWVRKLTQAEVNDRLDMHHRPYHTALHHLAVQAVARWQSAVILDVHSMPPLPGTRDNDAPQIVIGDLYGRSASARYTEIIAHVARRRGYRVAINAPYPGNFLLERHGRPDRGLHAIQIEIDRRLYLDPWLVELRADISAVHDLITAIVRQLSTEINGHALATAAE